jgi:bla regulator protein blaR1
MMTGLLNHLWQSTLVALVAWLATLALRRDRAAVRYAVWLVASLKFLVPLAWLTTLGTRIGWHPVVVASFVPYQIIVETSAGPWPEQAVRFSAMPPAMSTTHRLFTLVPDVLLGVWAAGALTLIATWLVRWRRISKISRASTPLTHGPVVESLRRIEVRLGVTRPVAIVASTGSLEPGVFGILSPTLVWPSRLDQQLSQEQVEAILSHEVTHVRRFDNLGAFVHLCAQAAFWFHPMVWWIGRRLLDERERACDEEVLGGGSERHAYAESILKTCRLAVESPLVCVSGVTGADLKKRIEHIMTNDIRPSLKTWKKCLLAAAASAAIAVPFAVGVMTVVPVQAGQAGRESSAREESHRRTLELRQVRQALEERLQVAEGYRRALSQAAASATDDAFEVASVKANKSGQPFVQIGMAPGGRFTATNVPLRQLILMAYQLQPFQIEGAPDWITTERFDVIAKGSGPLAPRAPGLPGPLQAMMQSLLADRFKLVAHIEKKEMPIYALMVAHSDGRLGAQLKASSIDCAAINAGRRGGPPPGGPPDFTGAAPQCGMMVRPGGVKAGGVPINQILQLLSQNVQRIVVDRTGLAGNYDIDLTWTPEQIPQGRGDPPPGAPALPPIDPNGPSLFTALQEQLGLRLESTRGPVDVLVVEKVERPTED